MSCRVCNACTDGREFDCVNRIIWGFQTGPNWGAFSEITHLPEVNISKIPEGVSYDEAAAASMTLLTSWHMLVGRAKIRPGQTVLIMGGGSGVGSFGIQIAKLYNCDVIATASPDKLDKLELGADFAVDHRKEDWYKEVRAISKELAKKKMKHQELMYPLITLVKLTGTNNLHYSSMVQHWFHVVQQLDMMQKLILDMYSLKERTFLVQHKELKQN